MTADIRCAECKHRLYQPSPDGLGPRCRRKRRDRWLTTPAGRAAAAVRRRLGTPARPLPGQLAIPKEHMHMADIRLTCLDEQHAAAVIDEATRPGDPDHKVRQEGAVVVITYFDKRYPLDVADWAGQHGHATDHDAATVIARL
ncbi:hypothetical protein ACFUEN_29200 [Streptomyces griseorubiginosus]|uniref:hypothetical protein n=1 Tax=Streptomyces griseorubiginosus TaxID=67304 RepID=UPI003642B204